MAPRAATLLLLFFLHVCSPDRLPVRPPTSWLQHCRSSTAPSITALEVLPGGGWDNLRNLDMGRVMNFNYTQCQTTEDGYYLVPDEVFVIPRKVTNVQTFAEIISSWLEHSSSTAASINMEASYQGADVGVTAKFSAEHERVKTNQVRDRSDTSRVQIRNNIYTVKAYPDFTLDPHFVRQLENVADAIANNQVRQATYLSEKIVADYGTHVVTSVDAGATLVKDDYIKSSYVLSSDTQSTSVKASAGFTFLSLFSMSVDIGFKQNSSDQSKYDNSVTSSFIVGHGGTPFYPNMSLDAWQESTKNNLIAIDRSGLPLHYVINTNTFPDLPEPTVNKVALYLQQAIKRYHTVNTHPGCVDVDSPNFNFQANVDDKSCAGAGTNLSFGGVFQKCETYSGSPTFCQELAQTNLHTGNYSCSEPYQPMLLRTEVKTEDYAIRHCESVSYTCWLFLTCYEKVCEYRRHVNEAKVHTYWCYSNGPEEDHGFLFGGLYGNSLENPITKRKSCPQYFTPIKFLANDLMICLSDDYELGAQNAVPFGGLFSCESTNPLAGDQNHCPPQFSQHQAAVSDGCEILYCVKSGLFRGNYSLSIRLPPFTRPPTMSLLQNNTITVMTEGNETWIKLSSSKSWISTETDDLEDMIKRYAPYSPDARGLKAGIGLGVIALVSFMIAGVVLAVRWKKGLPLCKKDSHREEETLPLLGSNN